VTDHDFFTPAREVPNYDLLAPHERKSNFRHMPFEVAVETLDARSAEVSIQKVISVLTKASSKYKGPIRNTYFGKFIFSGLPEKNGRKQFINRAKIHRRVITVQSSDYLMIGRLISLPLSNTANIALNVIER